jgi:hypothetical protein
MLATGRRVVPPRRICDVGGKPRDDGTASTVSATVATRRAGWETVETTALRGDGGYGLKEIPFNEGQGKLLNFVALKDLWQDPLHWVGALSGVVKNE